MAQPAPDPHALVPPPRSSSGMVWLALFGLPFAAVGLWVAAQGLAGVLRGDPWSDELWTSCVIGTVFTLAGGGILALARWLHVRHVETEALRSLHPDRPWRWRKEWATGRVPAQDGVERVVLWVFTAIWNAMSWPIVFQMDEPGAALFGWLFPAVGVCLFVWALRSTLRGRRFGQSHFELETHPGVVGGALRGRVHVPVAVDAENGFEVRLQCQQECGTGKSKNTVVLWEETVTVPKEAAAATPLGTAIAVAFTIPSDATPSSAEPDTPNPVQWMLEAKAAVRGIDFFTRFELPVFRTAESRADVIAAPVEPPSLAPAGVLTESSLATALREGSRITVRALSEGGVLARFPAARNPGAALGLTAATIFWNAIVSVFVFALSDMGAMKWFGGAFISIFVVAGLFLVWATFDAWLGSVRIRARQGELEVAYRMLGLGPTRRLRAGEVERIEAEINGQAGTKTHYRLRAHRRTGRPKTLARGIPDKREAETLAALLDRAFRGE